MNFTFYGDLLGIGSAYKLGPKAAYDKLNRFYNSTFRLLPNDPQTHVEMFSDSLLIKGDDASASLRAIANLFANLVRSGLLLRGAMVKGRLSYDARVTRPNFEKRLPDDDTLARAAGLEKSQKGSRFLIEPELANDLLVQNPPWLTQEGYIREIHSAGSSQLRRICPTPDSVSYEYLYFWGEDTQLEEYAQTIKDLKDTMKMYDAVTSEHFKETIACIERAQHRHKTTYDRLGALDGT